MAALLTVLGWLGRSLGDLLESPHCTGCDRRLRKRALWCEACHTTLLDPVAVELDALAVDACAPYGGALADALQRLKYHGRPDLARPLGQLLHRRWPAHARGPVDLLVPVPLHPRRLASRGFNQAALLARSLAVRLDIPLDCQSLQRIVDTPSQVSLDGRARRRNVRHAFVVRRPQRITGRRVLLIDDVATTGATLTACAVALRRAGAADVRAYVVARRQFGDISMVVTA